jgi:hypothetical protein
VELVRSLSWVDLAIILVLAVGVFAGFTQGTITYLLKLPRATHRLRRCGTAPGPAHRPDELLDGVHAEGRELIVFLVLFVGLTVAAWLVIWRAYRRSRLPIRNSSTRSVARSSDWSTWGCSLPSS